MIPSIAFAVVVSQDPDNYALNVSAIGTPGGQMPTLPVSVATHGPRDGARGSFPELPLPGTLGVVVFPRADSRNGVWLGSIGSALIDASPGSPGAVGLSHHAFFSGAFVQQDAAGNSVLSLADGTTLTAGSPAAPTRHTLDANQARQRTSYPTSNRRPAASAALSLNIAHKSGTTVQIAGNGSASVNVPSGQTLSIQVGIASIEVDSSGDMTLTVGGVSVALFPGSILITGDTKIDGDLTVTGGVQAGTGTGDSVTLQHHTHPANGTPPTPGT